MPTLDSFSGSAFNTRSLTASVNKVPFTPNTLGRLGIFTVKGVTSPLIQVEEKNGKLSLVPNKPRDGGASNYVTAGTRKMHPFTCAHLPLNDSVVADEVLGVRAFGSETDEEILSEIVVEKQQALVQNIQVTLEFQRINALSGIVYDFDGTTVLADFLAEFGITLATTDINFSSDDVMAKSTAIARQMEDGLGGLPMTGIYAICGNTYWDRLVANSAVKLAYTEYVKGGSQFLINNQRADGFYYGGIFWTNYRGQVGTAKFVADTKAKFFPLGVPDLFNEVYAPANYNETVGTKGKPYYSKMERMKFDKGMELEVQSNPLCICNRPGALVGSTTTG